MISREEQRQDPVSVPPLLSALNLPSSSVPLSSPPASRCLPPLPPHSHCFSSCLRLSPHPLLLPSASKPPPPSAADCHFFRRTSWEEESFCEPLTPLPPTSTTSGFQTGRQTLIPTTPATVYHTSPVFVLRLSVTRASRRTPRRAICIEDSPFVRRRGLSRQGSDPDPPSIPPHLRVRGHLLLLLLLLHHLLSLHL